MGCPGDGRTSRLATGNLSLWQNATLVAEKAALQGQLQHLEGQLGSLQGRAQELLLQSQRAQEHSSRLQVCDSMGLLLVSFYALFSTPASGFVCFQSAFPLTSAVTGCTFSLCLLSAFTSALTPIPRHPSISASPRQPLVFTPSLSPTLVSHPCFGPLAWPHHPDSSLLLSTSARSFGCDWASAIAVPVLCPCGLGPCPVFLVGWAPHYSGRPHMFHPRLKSL